jgi:hypothetical protein
MALEHIRLALNVDPMNGAIIGTHGNVQFALGRIEAAIESYESAVELGWGDAAQAFLGVVYLHLDDAGKAGPCLRAGRFAAEAIPPDLVDEMLDKVEANSGASTELGDRILSGAANEEISPALAFRLCALLGQAQIFAMPFDECAVPGDAVGTLWHPPAAPIREDERFPELLARFGLPPPE